MKKFQIDKDDISEKSIENKIETLFGQYEEESNGKYVINNPRDSILKSLRIEISEEHIYLDIAEKELDKIVDDENLDNVEDVLRKKNKFLRHTTGRSVKDRKKRMRREVTDISRVEENPALEKY